MKNKDRQNIEKLRIIPLGGCEEVGRNMTIFEYGQDIVILDMGIQFPEEDMPGIDFVIPNTKYLEGKEKNIKGVIFTHGHLDHIGAAPILLEKLKYPLIIGSDLTIELLKLRQEDYKKHSSQNLKIRLIKNIEETITLGNFRIKFFPVEHSIVAAMGVILESPSGTVVHLGDWTLERNSSGQPTMDYSNLKALNRPITLMLESLGATNSHRLVSYEEMYKNLKEIISFSPGRVIVGTFSSQIERTGWIIEMASRAGKKVALDGHSLKMSIEIAYRLGYIKIPKNTLINIKQINDYPDNKVIVICTGAQGEERAVLTRIVSGIHRYIKLQKNDTVIFSSSVIPGNERSIQKLKDAIYRQSDHVIHSEIMDVHVSGHATQKDIVEILDMIQPDYFIPVYAYHYMLKEAALLASRHGFPAKNIFIPDNGTIIEINKNSAKVAKEKATSDYVFVDGLGVSDMQDVVLRDRQVLAEDGMVVVIITIDSYNGRLVQNPDIISRGFVFLKKNKDLIENLRKKVRQLVEKNGREVLTDPGDIKNIIRDKTGEFLFKKTEKRPMVLPVVIEV